MIREFGATAWGKDWLRLAEPTATDRPDPALPRARSLARNDRVHDLELTAGRVTAVVDDRGCYRVDIAVAVWNDTQLDRARNALVAVPPSADLPDDLHTALRNDGQDPAPSPADLTAGCDCTSRKRPCPHILATYFDLARRLDERPRLALALRGLTSSDRPPETARVPLTALDPALFYGR